MLLTFVGMLGVAGCAKPVGMDSGPGEDLDSVPSWDPGAARPPVTDVDQPPSPLLTLTDTIDDPLGSLRVQVFPHAGKYSTPQGKETVFGEVTFRAEGAGKVCRVYQVTGMQPNSSEPEHGDRPIRSGASITVRLSELRVQLWVACDSESTTLVREAALKSYRYKGGFHVRSYVNEAGKPSVQVVNVVSFNHYLRGVVPAEMPAGWNTEALRAQSVAARTYAYQSVLAAREAAARRVSQDKAAEFFELDDTVFYQAYTGESGSHPNTDAAIGATVGQLLMYRNQPIIAYFSADSGGHTEDASAVWLVDAPYCQAKAEIFDQVLVPKPWKVTYTQEQVTQRLLKWELIEPGNSVRSMRILASERNRSGRATTVRVTLANGAEKSIDALRFQRAMSLKSTLITIQRGLMDESGEEKASYSFDGRGFGHGAGMSQWGAKALADSLDWNYGQILHFYYSDVTLCTLVRADVSDSMPLCN